MSVQIINFRPAGNETWTGRAACVGPLAPDMFPAPSDDVGIEAAKKACGVCPVWEACLALALDHNESDGVWGGLTTDERHSMRRRAARRALKDQRS